MQSIRIAGKPVEPVQMNICKSNTYRKDLSWLHFDDEGPTVLYTHFCSLSNIFKQQLGAPIFLVAVLAVEIMQKPQSNLEEKDNPTS